MLGDAFKGIGERHKAAVAYQRAIKIKSGDADFYREVGVMFKSMEMFEEAADCFKKALKIRPDMINIKYQLATLGAAEDPGRAPADYVTKLFDHFSDDFEEKLLNDLEYKTPYVLGDLIRKHLAAGCGKLEVLDLGCGTGLCGPVLTDLSSRLVGVDLSPRMLEQAKSKMVYDELIVGDIAEDLFSDSTSFDLIVAADVFVYVGNLAPIFEVSRSLLDDGGLFVFSTEVSDDGDDFTLQSTGRYKHATDYLLTLAKRFGFRVEEVVSTEIRKNKNIPVMGNLVLLVKCPTATPKTSDASGKVTG